MKECACGITYSAEQWADLPLVGEQRFEDGVTMELRNCSCGSTMGIELPKSISWVEYLKLILQQSTAHEEITKAGGDPGPWRSVKKSHGLIR